MQRRVVLIQEQQHRKPVDLMQEPGQEAQRRPQLAGPGLAAQDAAKERLVLVVQAFALDEVAVFMEGLRQHLPQGGEAGLPAAGLDVLEAEGDDRVAPEVGADFIRLRAAGDGQIGEERPAGGLVVIATALEEGAQHGQVGGLAEAPRPGQEDGLGTVVDEVSRQQRLVDVDGVLRPQLAEVRGAQANAHGRYLATPRSPQQAAAARSLLRSGRPPTRAR